jgi:hypothetical protein
MAKSVRRMESLPAMSRASLIDAFISGLQLTEVAIVGAGKRCRIITGEPAPGELIQHRYYFKPSHADLLLDTIGPEGLLGRPAVALAGAIEQTAARLGARWQTSDALRKAAGAQVDEIVERIKASGQRGKLKSWNARYKEYRLGQAAKGEKAIGYWTFLEQAVTLPTVRSIAASL